MPDSTTPQNSLKQLMDFIESQAATLKNHSLINYITNSSIDPSDRIKFAPSMLYYIMGFRDIIRSIQRNEPDTTIEKYINIYCQEDQAHWVWYLNDLKKLNLINNISVIDFCDYVWDRKRFSGRRVLYRIIAICESNTNPIYLLTVILLFESVGIIFLSATHRLSIDLCQEESLKYFGRKHYHEELNHTGLPHHLINEGIEDKVLDHCKVISLIMVKEYHNLFDNWFEDCVI